MYENGGKYEEALMTSNTGKGTLINNNYCDDAQSRRSVRKRVKGLREREIGKLEERET
jgi:hypothetical protein